MVEIVSEHFSWHIREDDLYTYTVHKRENFSNTGICHVCANEFTNECKASTKHQFLRTKFHKRRSERNRLSFAKSLNDPNDPRDACSTVSWLRPTRLFAVAATRKYYFDMHFVLLSENLRERKITQFFFWFNCVDEARCIFEALLRSIQKYIYIFLHILH